MNQTSMNTNMRSYFLGKYVIFVCSKLHLFKTPTASKKKKLRISQPNYQLNQQSVKFNVQSKSHKSSNQIQFFFLNKHSFFVWAKLIDSALVALLFAFGICRSFVDGLYVGLCSKLVLF